MATPPARDWAPGWKSASGTSRPTVSRYRLKHRVLITESAADVPVETLVQEGADRPTHQIAVFPEVEGAANYLPAYAGNLAIMASAALQMAERIAPHTLDGWRHTRHDYTDLRPRRHCGTACTPSGTGWTGRTYAASSSPSTRLASMPLRWPTVTDSPAGRSHYGSRWNGDWTWIEAAASLPSEREQQPT